MTSLYTFALWLLVLHQACPVTSKTGCPPGVEVVSCFVNPCDVNTCPAYPLAECRANYCGGCFAEYYVEDKQVDCSVCRDGQPPQTCDNPCQYARPAPGYTCVPQFCCECSMRFVKLCDKNSKPKECLVDPCVTANCPSGYTCQANHCDCSAECLPATKG